MKKLLLSTAVCSALIGCSTDDQDSPELPIQEINPSVSGVVIDPFVTGAIVFADYDNDDVLDPFEPRAITDKDGYFGVSAQGEDYCALGQLDYCLQLNSADNVTIKAVGGYDRSTLSKLNTRFSFDYQGSNTNVVISPLSSLGALAVNNQQTVNSDVNFMADPLADEQSIQSLRLAFSTALIIEKITEMIGDDYRQIGDHEDLPSDLSGFIYQALETIGQQKDVSIEALLSDIDTEDVTVLLALVESALEDAYESAGLVTQDIDNKVIKAALIADAISAIDTTGRQILTIDNANLLVEYIDGNPDLGVENVSGHIVSGLTKATKGIGELAFELPSIAEQVAPIFTPQVLNVIAQDNFNADAFEPQEILEEVIRQGVDISDLEAIAEVVNTYVASEDLTLDANALPESLANNQVTFAQYGDKDIAASLHFGGDLFAEQGTLNACVKYQDNQDPDDELNTQGKLLTGSWQRLSDYHLTVNLEIAGTTQVSQVAKITDLRFSFDFDDEVREFTSSAGIVEQNDDIPASDEQCQMALANF